ncbi:hypothetical protein chiPu_0031122, partial [Chiloscyllium punctatum]|nr:hypothetical protein [Chiloscyllium punctatum]
RAARPAHRALAGRQLRHLARHGRLLAHGEPARCRDDGAVGRPGAHGRIEMVNAAMVGSHELR